MICADLRLKGGTELWPVGALGCFTESLHCEKAPARCTTCRKAITDAKPHLRCGCTPTPDGRACLGCGGAIQPVKHDEKCATAQKRPCDCEAAPFVALAACRCCAKPSPDSGCADPGEHSDPASDCARVVLARRPLDGEHGPHGYDPKTQEPIPHAENTRLARLADLDRALADRDRLVRRAAVLKDASATEKEVAALDERIQALAGAVQ